MPEYDNDSETVQSTTVERIPLSKLNSRETPHTQRTRPAAPHTSANGTHNSATQLPRGHSGVLYFGDATAPRLPPPPEFPPELPIDAPPAAD
jgi:hypothetical protein